jgi:hypothetical protein
MRHGTNTLWPMTDHSYDFQLHWSTDTFGADRFCQVRLATAHGDLGDPEAWSVTGLVQRAIDDLTARLTRQPAIRVGDESALSLFTTRHRWHHDRARASPMRPGRDPAGFLALPEGTELFDGEIAYLARTSPRARLIWRDYATTRIQEIAVDFDAYIECWRTLRATLDDEGSGRLPAAA